MRQSIDGLALRQISSRIGVIRPVSQVKSFNRQPIGVRVSHTRERIVTSTPIG